MTEALSALRHFFKTESAGGLLLMAAAALAVLVANSELSDAYHALLNVKLTITLGGLGVDKPILFWVNDGLMALFFLLVGLEIKREVMEGELSSVRQAALPFIAACGGVLCPALIYTALNQGDALAMKGWAVPTATDIAFALGVLALFGSRVPLSLKVFLTAIAVIDDLFAVVIIALFYTAELSSLALTVGGACLALLLAMNLLGVRYVSVFIIVGVIMWLAVLKSGVHATLAGVALGLLVPHRAQGQGEHSMLRSFEHCLHPWVAFGILPIFAFANAGINLSAITLDAALDAVPLGVALGLFAGKQVGVFLFSLLAIVLGLAQMPKGANFRQLYAISLLCGVGFTMSLFIGSLAFGEGLLMTETQLGVMAGSVISALAACALLHAVLPKRSS